MAEYTANAVQTVAAGQNVVFTDTSVNGCDLIFHIDNSGLIKLHPKTTSQFTRFLVAFSGNVALPVDGTPATPLSFAITIDGEPVQPTSMIVTPTAVSQYNNIAGFAYIYIERPCCSTIGVKNTGTVATNIQNANIIVKVA